MPRDLFYRRAADEAPLTESPDAKTPGFGSFAEQLQSSRGKSREDGLHPYVSTLGIADLKSCIALENAAFPEHERVCDLLQSALYSRSLGSCIFPLRSCVGHSPAISHSLSWKAYC